MRVLVLGAAGRTGREVSARLRGTRGVTRLYLSDRDAEALCKATSYLAGAPVSLRYLDVEDEDCLMERVSEADMVVGCAGPSHILEERVARAVVEAGRDYITLCDEPEAALALRELGPLAARKGVRILCGAGLTPGISNLLACRAAARLDEVHSVSIAWCLRLSSRLGPATLAHLMHICGSKAPVLRAGKEGMERPGSRPRTAYFPPPLGWRQIACVAHPEPLSLPAVLPGLEYADYMAGFGERRFDLAVQTLAWLYDGLEDSLAWREVLRVIISAFVGRIEGGPLSAVMVRAEGVVGKSPAAVVLATVGDYYGLAATAVAACLEHMRAEAIEPGFHFPEQVFDRPSFFARLGTMGVSFLVGEADGDAMLDGLAVRRVGSGVPCPVGRAGSYKR